MDENRGVALVAIARILVLQWTEARRFVQSGRGETDLAPSSWLPLSGSATTPWFAECQLGSRYLGDEAEGGHDGDTGSRGEKVLRQGLVQAEQGGKLSGDVDQTVADGRVVAVTGASNARREARGRSGGRHGRREAWCFARRRPLGARRVATLGVSG